MWVKGVQGDSRHKYQATKRSRKHPLSGGKKGEV
jgi:hypothetical protein